MRTPVHLWIVGLLSLLWNAGGAFDYAAIKLGLESYTAQLTEPMLAFLADLPWWYSIAWAVGVWFSVLGSILLLVPSRAAGSAFALSLVGLLVASFYSFVLLDSSPMRDAGAGNIAFTIAIYIVLILLILYSRAMRRRGILR